MTGRLLHVALVTPRFPPDNGGLETYVGWLARMLQESGRYDVTVVTTSRARRSRLETWQGIRVHRLATWVTVSNTPVNPAWWWQVGRLLRQLDVDIVSAHAPVPGLADLAALRSKAPVVLTYHAGSMVKGASPVDPLLRSYERYVLPRIFDRCAAVIAVSPVSLAQGTGRAHLIPPGVDTRHFRPTPVGTPGPAPRVLYAGRVERASRWKGLHVLIDALPLIRRAVPDVRLEVVGGGDDVTAMQQRAERLGVNELIDWSGRMPHGRLPDAYRRAAVTVLPSLTAAESFGMTLVEAMACGCPVVGSEIGGIPFVVRHGVDGLLVPPGDSTALADALVRVLRDRRFGAELGRAGVEAARGRWDWTHQQERTLAVLDAAVGEGVVV